MRAEFRHEIAVNLPMEEALPLFTPKGEEAWVPGWKPHYISPESGETGEEMLFTTDADGETTFWTCLKWQPAEGHARYLRTVPDSRMSIVDVRCRPDGNTRTRVQVAYEHYPLTAAGDAYVAALSPVDFAEMIDGWAALIENRPH